MFLFFRRQFIKWLGAHRGRTQKRDRDQLLHPNYWEFRTTAGRDSHLPAVSTIPQAVRPAGPGGATHLCANQL